MTDDLRDEFDQTTTDSDPGDQGSVDGDAFQTTTSHTAADAPPDTTSDEGSKQGVLHTGTAEFYEIAAAPYQEIYGDSLDADVIAESIFGPQDLRDIDRTEDETAAGSNRRREGVDESTSNTEAQTPAFVPDTAAPLGTAVFVDPAVTLVENLNPATAVLSGQATSNTTDPQPDAKEPTTDIDPAPSASQDATISGLGESIAPTTVTPPDPEDVTPQPTVTPQDPVITPSDPVSPPADPTPPPTSVDVNEPPVVTVPAPTINAAPTEIALNASTVAENAAGAVIGTVSATDPDGDALTYTVDDARFEIVDGALQLKPGQSLDHETSPTLDVQITATDPGGLSSSETFTITVSDVNEAPVDVGLSNLTVAENAAGAVIGTVSATDPDGDALSYTVDDARFEIVDGALQLKPGQSLDHEASPTLDVQITATDPGGLSSSETFTITVSDVNEAPVDVGLSNLTVAENAAGAVIGTVSATEPDGDALTYTVDDARFEIVDGALQLRSGQSLDHEASPTLDVQITATDPGGLSSSETFTITVSDVNEAPVDVGLSNLTVAENAAGAVIGTVSATDPDGDALTYTVDDARFEIVDGALQLRSGQSLDHEASPTLDVQITATDPGGLSSSETFTITVGDVNEAPVDVGLSNTTVAENAAGAVIGTVSATDPDGDALSYTVDDARFEIVDGALQLKPGQSLDHETSPTLDVQITATDPGGLSSSETFTITVSDEVTLPPDISVGGAFHVQQYAVVEGVTDIAGVDFGSDPLGELFVSQINFSDSQDAFVSHLPQDAYATLVRGHVYAETDGTYEFEMSSPDTSLLWIDGVLVGIETLDGLLDTGVVTLALDAGNHDIVIKHLDLDGDTGLSLSWRPEGEADFSLVTASTELQIEEADEIGVPIALDTHGNALDAVVLSDVPADWIVSVGNDVFASTGAPIDLTGLDLSQLSVEPVAGDVGLATLTLSVTNVSPSGEPGTQSIAIDIDVEAEDGLGIVDLLIGDALDPILPDALDPLGGPDLGLLPDPDPDGADVVDPIVPPVGVPTGLGL